MWWMTVTGQYFKAAQRFKIGYLVSSLPVGLRLSWNLNVIHYTLCYWCYTCFSFCFRFFFLLPCKFLFHENLKKTTNKAEKLKRPFDFHVVLIIIIIFIYFQCIALWFVCRPICWICICMVIIKISDIWCISLLFEIFSHSDLSVISSFSLFYVNIFI